MDGCCLKTKKKKENVNVIDVEWSRVKEFVRSSQDLFPYIEAVSSRIVKES